MNAILDRLKKKAMDIISGIKTLDDLANMNLGKLLFGVSDSIKTEVVPAMVSAPNWPKFRRLRKRANNNVKLTSDMSAFIRTNLSPLVVGSKEYLTERNQLCKEFELSPKQVSGVLQGHKGWAARQAKMKTKRRRRVSKKK